MNDSDRLLAAGVPLTLTDGRQVQLRYGMRAVKELTDLYGGWNKVSEAMTDNTDPVGNTINFLAAGLRHEGLTTEDLYELTDLRKLLEYSETIGKALEESLPVSSPGNLPGEENSPGKSFTTPALLDSVAATNNSGR